MGGGFKGGESFRLSSSSSQEASPSQLSGIKDVTVQQELRGKGRRLLPADAPPDLLVLNCTPAKLDYIRSVLICFQMGISCEIVIKGLNYSGMVFLFLGPGSRAF